MLLLALVLVWVAAISIINHVYGGHFAPLVGWAMPTLLEQLLPLWGRLFFLRTANTCV